MFTHMIWYTYYSFLLFFEIKHSWLWCAFLFERAANNAIQKYCLKVIFWLHRIPMASYFLFFFNEKCICKQFKYIDLLVSVDWRRRQNTGANFVLYYSYSIITEILFLPMDSSIFQRSTDKKISLLRKIVLLSKCRYFGT